MSGKSPLYGIHAATVAPLKDDFRVDHSTLKGLIADICSIQGIEGFLINGHAGEHAQLSSSEKTEVIKSVCDVVSKNLYITSGVYSENTLQAVKDAENAEHAGADALLVFPPNGWALGQERKTILATIGPSATQLNCHCCCIRLRSSPGKWPMILAHFLNWRLLIV